MSKLSTTLGHLAELVGGRHHGDPQLAIHGAAVLGEVARGEITLVDHVDRIRQLNATPACAVLLAEKIAGDYIATNEDPARKAAIVVADVHTAFATIVCHFRPQRFALRSASAHWRLSAPRPAAVKTSISTPARRSAMTALSATALPSCPAQILAGCQLGSDVLIGPGAMLYENTVVGDRAIIHGGAVIGAYGFGYSQAGGRHVLSAQLGYVRIGDDVEIGAASTIDRGTYGATSIGEGTKIDNMVQIAHNCRIGRHNLICAQVGIAGSSTTGDYVVIGGQAGLRDHVHIGTGARLSAMAGITNDVPDGAVMMGIPATPEREQKLKLAAMAKLPEMRQEFKAQRRAIQELQKAAGLDNQASGNQQSSSKSSDQAA